MTSDLKRPLREQAIRMEEQLKASRIGWPAAAILIVPFVAIAAIYIWGC